MHSVLQAHDWVTRDASEWASPDGPPGEGQYCTETPRPPGITHSLLLPSSECSWISQPASGMVLSTPQQGSLPGCLPGAGPIAGGSMTTSTLHPTT